MKNDLVKLSLDIYRNDLGQFSQTDANTTLRQKMIELYGSDRIDYKSYRRHKPEFFEIIEEVLDVTVQQGLKEDNFFNSMVDYRDLNIGESNVFHIPDRNLFDVSMVAEGNNNIRRQRIDTDSVVVTANTYSIKIYDELNRFLSGAIDWVELVNRVKESFKAKIFMDIYTGFRDAYSKLPAAFAETGSYVEDKFLDLVQHVEAASGKAMVVGTKKALRRIVPTVIGEASKDAFNENGFFVVVNGTPMMALGQVHKPNTFDFALSDNEVYVIPVVSTKPVKMVREGSTVIIDGTNNTNQDESIEYSIKQKYGINVVLSSYFGIYRFS